MPTLRRQPRPVQDVLYSRKPDPILLRLPKAEILPRHRLAEGGDREAAQYMAHLWDAHPDGVPCFTCGVIVAPPIPSLITVDPVEPWLMILMPQCPECWEVAPASKKWRRCLDVLKQVQRRRTGDTVLFSWAPSLSYHPR